MARSNLIVGGRPGFPGRRTAVQFAVAGALLFVAGALLPPVLEGAGLPGGQALRAAYHPLCHQIPSRSLCWAGRPLAICARCAGLYLGGALALVIAALAREVPRVPAGPLWLALALAPTVLDALAGQAGVGELSNIPRLAIAVPAGLAAGLYLAVGLADLGGRRWTNGLPIFSGPR